MSVTNDPKLVQPQGTEEMNRGQRPKWVVAAVIWFVLFGLVGGCSGVKLVNQIGQIDLVNTANRLGVQEEILNWIIAIEIFFYFAFSLGMLASSIGMWELKKWGALVCLIVTLPFVGSLILSQFQKRTLDLTTIIFLVVFAVIAVGQVNLWRKGKLT